MANSADQSKEFQALLPKYQFIRRLGEGSFGWTYLMKNELGRLCVVKQLKSLGQDELQKQSEMRFKQEAQTLAKLQHPNIVDIYEFLETEGNYYLVMPYARHGTLQSLLKLPENQNGLPIPDAIKIVNQLCLALQAAHNQRVLHRDIKLENVLLADREGLTVWLADFGIALWEERAIAITSPGASVGTPLYMSPEQMKGKAVLTSDIFSLGAVLYRLLTNDSGGLRQYLKSHFEVVPSPRQIRPEIPHWLDYIVKKCLAKDPAKRYQSANALRQALQPTSSLSISEHPVVQSQPTEIVQDALHPTPSPSAAQGKPTDNLVQVSKPTPSPSTEQEQPTEVVLQRLQPATSPYVSKRWLLVVSISFIAVLSLLFGAWQLSNSTADWWTNIPTLGQPLFSNPLPSPSATPGTLPIFEPSATPLPVQIEIVRIFANNRLIEAGSGHSLDNATVDLFVEVRDPAGNVIDPADLQCEWIMSPTPTAKPQSDEANGCQISYQFPAGAEQQDIYMDVKTATGQQSQTEYRKLVLQ